MSGADVLALLVAANMTPPAGWAELTPPEKPFARSEGFEKIAEAYGVTVYKSAKSAEIRLAADGTMYAPADDIVTALLDYDRQIGVVARVSEIEVLERGPLHIIVYQRLNLPVIADRDYVLMVTWGRSDGTRWIKYWALGDAGPPPRPGVVRVTRHDGSWQILPDEGGQASRVRYQVRIDLGGLLPKWMARAGAGSEVPLVYRDICRMLRPERKPGEALCLR